MRKTKIICTLGPASETEEVLREMIKAGMNVARFNFSHGSHEEHQKKLDIIKKLRQEMDIPLATAAGHQRSRKFVWVSSKMVKHSWKMEISSL